MSEPVDQEVDAIRAVLAAPLHFLRRPGLAFSNM